MKEFLFSSKSFIILLAIFFILLIFFLFWYFFTYKFLPRFRFAMEVTLEDIFTKNKDNVNKTKYNKEDSIERNKVKEKKKELDKELELDILSKTLQQNKRPKIVGFNLKVFGKFTKKFVENFLMNTRNLDISDLNDKGFYQAQELARRSKTQQTRGSSKQL
ncbi:MAG: hypothetical protein JJW01_00305 [Alphaproteobacteria bacterium]|nr:hypothetical protein [Rickettsiales bacterium]